MEENNNIHTKQYVGSPLDPLGTPVVLWSKHNFVYHVWFQSSETGIMLQFTKMMMILIISSGA